MTMLMHSWPMLFNAFGLACFRVKLVPLAVDSLFEGSTFAQLDEELLQELLFHYETGAGC